MSEEKKTAVIFLEIRETLFPIAIAIDDIEELTRIPKVKVHPVPRSKPFFVGVFIFREEIIPLLDLEIFIFNTNSTPQITKEKIPVFITNVNGVRISFMFNEVLKYGLVGEAQSTPEKLSSKLKFTKNVYYHEEKGSEPEKYFLVKIKEILKEFVEVKPETPRIRAKDEIIDDFDISQFTIKEGEKFDPSKLKF